MKKALQFLHPSPSFSKPKADDKVTKMTTSHFLISFFEGIGPSPVSEVFGEVRYLREILKWPDRDLERVHDYIQTLFPLPEASLFNDDAWLVDEIVFNAFRSRQDLRLAQKDCFIRMLRFYGLYLESNETKMECRRLPDFGGRSFQTYWLRSSDHNHARISRIIRSMRILGQEDEARAFYDALMSINDFVYFSKRSLRYWQRAMDRPLNISPDLDDDEITNETGLKFLRDAGMKEETRSNALPNLDEDQEKSQLTGRRNREQLGHEDEDQDVEVKAAKKHNSANGTFSDPREGRSLVSDLREGNGSVSDLREGNGSVSDLRDKNENVGHPASVQE